MAIGRRELMGAGLGLGAVLAADGAAAVAMDPPPSPAADDPAAPRWPAAERISLWPAGRMPDALAHPPTYSATMNGAVGHRQLWVKGIAVPELNVFRPARPDGTALLTIPGGGYGFLSVQNEGLDVARHFTARGTTVLVLSYRLPGEGWPNRALVPLSDAQRAMRVARANSARLGIDPARLGVLGFSAGGHLAGDLATAWGRQAYRAVDQTDALPARPAFAGLIYPVFSLDAAITHPGSRDALLGPNPGEALVADRSPLAHVAADTPPLFFVHAADDGLVPVANSLRGIDAALAAKLPVEAHIFERGGHGFGLGLPAANTGSLWPELFERWYRTHV